MARTGFQKAIMLLACNIGSGGGERGALHRVGRAGNAIAIGRWLPRPGMHVRKLAPVLLLAAALAEWAHSPWMNAAKAMSWNPLSMPGVRSHARDAAQSPPKKLDRHGPAGVTELLRKENPEKISPDFKVWERSTMSADPTAPQEPISLIHDHAVDPVVFGPIHGSSSGSAATLIVHGALYDRGGDGGAAGGDTRVGSGGAVTPPVLAPTEVIAVPEPTSVGWIFGISTMLRRHRR